MPLIKPINIYIEEVPPPAQVVPKINPLTIRFNNGIGPKEEEEPERKPNYLTIIWWGLIGKDIDPSYFKKYDNLAGKVKPVLFIVILVIIIFFGAKGFTSLSTPEKGITKREVSFVDKIIDWIVDYYDIHGQKHKVHPKAIPTTIAPPPPPLHIPVPKQVDSIPIIEQSVQYDVNGRPIYNTN